VVARAGDNRANILVSPYFENFGKRIVKSPRIYWGDSGSACYLLGIETQAELDRSPFLGTLFEGYVASEILKSQINQGRRKELYYFRDRQGVEVDFLFPDGRGGVRIVECKASKTVQPTMAATLIALSRSMSGRTPIHMTLVHRRSKTAPLTRALVPGVEAVDEGTYVSELYAQPGKLD